MYGNLRNSGIPWIRSYHEAVRHYEDVKPIKGNGVNAGVRPLGSRKKPYMQIIAMEGGAMACRLYKTDVITFWPDNRITFDTGGHNTNTTANFIAQLLGRPCSKFDNRLVLHVAKGEYTVDSNLELKNEGWLEVVKCTPDVVHTIDRKAMNEARKKYTEFGKYLAGAVKLNDGELKRGDTVAALKNDLPAKVGVIPDNIYAPPKVLITTWTDHTSTSLMIDKFFALIEGGEAENWHLAFLWLAYSASQRYGSINIPMTEAGLKKVFDDALIAKNPHVLTRTLVPAGEIKIDRYKRFKPYKEE